MHARDALSTEIRHQHAVRTTTTTIAQDRLRCSNKVPFPLVVWRHRAGWWETNLVYMLSVEWVTDPLSAGHGCLLCIGPSCCDARCDVDLRGVVVCPGRALPLLGPCPMMAYPWLSDVLCFPCAGCDAGRCCKDGFYVLCSLLQGSSRISR